MEQTTCVVLIIASTVLVLSFSILCFLCSTIKYKQNIRVILEKIKDEQAKNDACFNLA